MVRPIAPDTSHLQASLDSLVRSFAQRGQSLHIDSGPDRFAIISERPADSGRSRAEMTIQCYASVADTATAVAQVAASEGGVKAVYELSPSARSAALFVSRRAVVLGRIDLREVSMGTIHESAQRLQLLHPEIEANTAIVLDGDKRFVAVTGHPARVALAWAGMPNCDQICAFVTRPEALLGVYDLAAGRGLKRLRIRIEVRAWGAASSGRGHAIV